MRFQHSIVKREANCFAKQFNRFGGSANSSQQHQPASFAISAKLAGLIFTFQAFVSSILARLSDYNSGATLISQRWYVHIFSVEFANRRGRRTRPCVECAFYSYTHSDSVITVKQLYIQNEGLSEIFWGARQFFIR